MNKKALKKFKVDQKVFNLLSQDEKQMIPFLEKACDLISEIYESQERDGSYYPKDVSDEQIKSAAKINPQILSPYTIVEKVHGKLIAVPFHKKHAAKLKHIANLLEKAASISKNKSFVNFLKITAKSLLTGDYKSIDKAWLKIKNNSLFFLVGPYERCLDDRFFTKMCYLGFIGIKDPYYTERSRRIRQIFFTNIVQNHERYTLPHNIRAVAIYNTVFAGYLARALFSYEHIPSDDSTIREFGGIVLGYISSINYKFENVLFPIFNTIFAKNFRGLYSKELLKKGCYYLVLVCGLARQLHRYENSRERLRELFPTFDEANSMVSGIQHSKYLVLKGVIDQRDLEAIIIMHICWIFSEWVFAKTNPIREDFLQGDALTFNFYLKQNALIESHGISWPNFSKIFFTIENLANTYYKILSKGTYKEAKDFLDKNLSYKEFNLFEKQLSKIKPL